MKHEFRNLKVWIKARELNYVVYTITSQLPKEEKYGLINQMRRASISISSNIAEGSGFDSDSQFLKYLFISLGSICELESQLYLCFDIGFVSQNDLDTIIKKSDEIKRMILGLKKKLAVKNIFNPKFLIILLIYTII